MSRVVTRKSDHIRSTTQHKCIKCGSTIEFDASDVRSIPRPGERPYCECPVCKGFINTSVIWPNE